MCSCMYIKMGRKLNNLYGTHIHQVNNMNKKSVRFKIAYCMLPGTSPTTRQKLQLPNCQTSLDEDKYKDMVDCYLKHPENWHGKNTICVGILDEKQYVIDGQHRLEALRILVEKHNITNDVIIVCYF